MAGYPPPPPNQGYPPPPGRGFHHPTQTPPSATGVSFAPPPPPGGTGFSPPAPGSGFAAPPPAQPSLGEVVPPPPPPPQGGGIVAPPPPPAGGAVQQLSQGMAHVSLQRPLLPGSSLQHPPPAEGAESGGYYQQHSNPAVGASPQVASPQAHTPFNNENVDFGVKIPERLVRFTTSKVAQTAQLASGTKIPFGAVMRPLAPKADDEEDIETVQPGAAGIIRCKRCRTYINAFVSWSEHGRRWSCNICSQINDCPAAYFCHLDDHGLRRDRSERPELSKAVVEFIAPAEYMVRPPQEPSYFFVIDVSATAVRSGVVRSAAKAIKESLDDLPGQARTKVGFITFDNAVHYYNLSSELSAPQMMVVADLKELFVPLPDHLLVNLQESRAVVEHLLDSLPEMFVKNPVVSQSCLGPALKAGFTVMKNIGGKLCVFQSVMPNLGDGALKHRENRSLMGTPNEVKLLRPEVTWYKDTAVEFSRQQISVDMFLFPFQYMDLASMAELPKYTAGSVYSYVSFNHKKDGPRFEQQLNKVLTQTTAFEAVMRVRCTKGMRISNFYGNFYIRGTDLLALPNCNTDSVFGFDLAHDEQNVATNYVTLQAALLYTSSEGQRRIRVMTQCLPVSNRSSEIIAAVDTDAVCNLLSKQALEVSVKTSLENARMRLQQSCVDIIRTSKEGDKRTVSGYTVPPPQGHAGGQQADEKPIPENLQLLPLYILALMKNVALRGGTDVHPDERIQAHRQLVSMWVTQSKDFIYPRMFAMHDMSDNVGYSVEDLTDGSYRNAAIAGRNRILLPPIVSLSVERLASNGLYLLDNGVDMYMWVGRATDISILGSLFGVQSLEDCDTNHLEVLMSGDPLASRLGAIVDALRDEGDHSVISPKIYVVREGDQQMESRFFWFLIEDRASFQGGTFSYGDFMHFVNNPNQPNQGGQSAPRGGGRGPPVGPSGMPFPPGQTGMPPPPPPGQAGMPPPPPPGLAGMPPPPQPGHTGVQPPPTPVQAGMPPPPGQAAMPPPQGQPGMPPPAPLNQPGMPSPSQKAMPPGQLGMSPPPGPPSMGQPGMPSHGSQTIARQPGMLSTGMIPPPVAGLPATPRPFSSATEPTRQPGLPAVGSSQRPYGGAVPTPPMPSRPAGPRGASPGGVAVGMIAPRAQPSVAPPGYNRPASGSSSMNDGRAPEGVPPHHEGALRAAPVPVQGRYVTPSPPGPPPGRPVGNTPQPPTSGREYPAPPPPQHARALRGAPPPPPPGARMLPPPPPGNTR